MDTEHSVVISNADIVNSEFNLFNASLKEIYLDKKMYKDDLIATLYDTSAKYQRTRGTTNIGPNPYKITIISNKELPMQFDVMFTDTIGKIKAKIEKQTKHKKELQVLLYRNGTMGCTYCDSDNTIEELYAPRILALKVESIVNFTLKYGDKTVSIQEYKSKTLMNEVAEITENKLILSSLICSHDDYDKTILLICGFLRCKVKEVPSEDVVNLMVDYYFIGREVNIFKSLQDECNDIVDGDTILIRKDTNKKYVEYADLGDEIFDIFVRTLTCKTLTIKVKVSSTIEDVKESIYQCYVKEFLLIAYH